MRDHFGNQHKFYRQDPTGRHSPLHIPRDIPDPWWLAWLGGGVTGLLLALILFLWL